MTGRLLTTREVAGLLGLSPESVLRRWRREHDSIDEAGRRPELRARRDRDVREERAAVNDELKRCRRCGRVKPPAEFRRNKRARDGLSSWCSDCHRGTHRRWLAASRDELTRRRRRRREVEEAGA